MTFIVVTNSYSVKSYAEQAPLNFELLTLN